LLSGWQAEKILLVLVTGETIELPKWIARIISLLCEEQPIVLIPQILKSIWPGWVSSPNGVMIESLKLGNIDRIPVYVLNGEVSGFRRSML
jgi:hypothetical protein